MFRTMFRSLTASRPQARRQIQNVKPKLESLEERWAPAAFHDVAIQAFQGSHNTIVQAGHHDVAAQVAQGSHNTIVQAGSHDVAIQAFQGSHNTIIQV